MFWESKHQPRARITHSHTHKNPSISGRRRAVDAEPEPRLGSSPPHGHPLPCPALILARFKPPCASEGGFPGARAKLKIILKLAFVSDRLFLCPPFTHPSHTSLAPPHAMAIWSLPPLQETVSRRPVCPKFPYRCRAVSLTPPPSDPLPKMPTTDGDRRGHKNVDMSEHTDGNQ